MRITNLSSIQYPQSTYLKKDNIKQSASITSPYLSYDTFIKSNTAPSSISFGKIDFDEVAKLQDAISTRPYGKRQLYDYKEQYDKAQGITLGGGFPEEWINRIDNPEQFDKEAFLERLGKLVYDDRHFGNLEIFQKGIENLFKQHGIAKENDIVDVDFIGKGFFGRAFKISINGEDSKVLKEFKRTKRYLNNHGNFSEQNIAEYIHRFAGNDTNVVKYYFGDMKNGYLIVDYLTKDVPPAPNKIVLSEIGIDYNDDKPRNYINDYIIDYGGMITISNLAGNKEAQEANREIKYAESDEKRIKLFNEIFNHNNPNEHVGLTHGVRYLPKRFQSDAYWILHSLGNKDVDIAIIENIKHMDFSTRPDDLLEILAQSEDKLTKEIMSREIKHFPDKLKHQLFDKLSQENNPTIKKYLARNINHYYKPVTNRPVIYERLVQNSDRYADIALVGALRHMGQTSVDEYFEHFFNKNDSVVRSVLARNIEFFEENPELMKKWVYKLLEVDDVRVARSMAESIPFMHKELREYAFEKLLNVYDFNTKEFLVEAMKHVPNYQKHPDWIPRLLQDADDTVRGSLAAEISNFPKEVRNDWIALILDGADKNMKQIIEKEASLL